MTNQLNLNLLAHLNNRRIVLLTLFPGNRLLVGSHFNLKGNPAVYFLACQVRDQVVYYPLERVLDNVDEKTLKRLKKNGGKLKKFIEKDHLPRDVAGGGLSDQQAEAGPGMEAREREGLLSRHMNSVGQLKTRIGSSLLKEVR